MTVSAAITGGSPACFYVQYFLFVDAGIAYWAWISVEALLAPIIGGSARSSDRCSARIVVQGFGELTKQVAGNAPGLDLVIYGVLF